MSLAAYDQLPVRRIAVDGEEICSIDTGHGPAVVLVHGSPVSSLEYRAVIARLATHFRVLAPDLLSFGRSSGPHDGADFTAQATALRHFLDTVGLERYHLVGHDWGGPIGVAAAARRAEQLERLVLLNTSIRADFRPPAYWRAMIAPRVGEAAIARANVFSRGLPLLLRAARRNAELRRRYAADLKSPPTRRTILKLERLQGYATECGRISEAFCEQPPMTMIVWGSPDPYFRQELKRLSGRLPNAHIVELPGAGHFATEDAATEVAAAIDTFLRAGA